MDIDSISMTPNIPGNEEDEKMYIYHYEKFMHYKNTSDCYRKMYEHGMMMAQYHYRMCLYYEGGGRKPDLPNEANEIKRGLPKPPL